MKAHKIIAFFLCLIFISNVFVCIPAMLYARYQLKAEMQEEIRKNGDGMETFTFTQSEFGQLTWFDNNSEFNYDDEMYDLVKIQKNNDGTYIIKAISDKKEKEIINKLKNQSRQNNNAKNHSGFFSVIADESFGTGVCSIIPSALSAKNDFRYSDHYSHVIAKKNSPPPKAA